MKRVYKPWSGNEEQELARQYAHHSVSEIAKDMGRTVNSIREKIRELGLKKNHPMMNAEFIASVMEQVSSSSIGKVAARMGICDRKLAYHLQQAKKHGFEKYPLTR